MNSLATQCIGSGQVVPKSHFLESGLGNVDMGPSRDNCQVVQFHTGQLLHWWRALSGLFYGIALDTVATEDYSRSIYILLFPTTYLDSTYSGSH